MTLERWTIALSPAAAAHGALAALLLAMMAMQTSVQLCAGVSFATQDIVPFTAFILISGGAIWFLQRVSRAVGAGTGSTGVGPNTP